MCSAAAFCKEVAETPDSAGSVSTGEACSFAADDEEGAACSFREPCWAPGRTGAGGYITVGVDAGGPSGRGPVGL